jgi:hypothetical protein
MARQVARIKEETVRSESSGFDFALKGRGFEPRRKVSNNQTRVQPLRDAVDTEMSFTADCWS